MAKRTNWWLEGWQYEEVLGSNGKHQKKLVYLGEYYDFPLQGKELTRMKLAVVVLAVLLLCSYVLTFTLLQSGAMRFFVGACMLSVIPLMYLLIGVACLIPVKSRLTFRDYRGSVVRIRWTSTAIAILEALGFVGELIHLLTGPVLLDTELWWLLGTFLCCASAFALAMIEQRFRPRLVPPDLR